MSAPPYGNPPARTLPNGMAVASLVLGILGLVLAVVVVGGVLGLVAVILGAVALGKIKRGEAGGRGMAIAGIVTGGLAMLLAGLLLAAGAVFFARNAEEFSNLADCVAAADNDQAEIDACQEEFVNRFNP